MTNPIRNLVRRYRGAMDAAQRRFRRARPGSVLILVVALLVLMALIGTAFITTTGNDRYSASQNMQNTEIELLIEGVRQIAIAEIVKKVTPGDPPGTATLAFRPAHVSKPGQNLPAPQRLDNAPFQYANVDFSAWDPYLASRHPELNNQGTLIPIWRYISASPFATSREGQNTNGSSPGPNPNNFLNQWASPFVGTDAKGTQIVPRMSSRFALAPGVVVINYPNGVQRGYPALGPSSVTNDPAVGVGQFILAADCDGDGIADAGLFELPVPVVNGVRYYGAVRIVDNCALIDPTIAWQPGGDANMPANVFASNIDFASLVNATDGGAALNNYNNWRFGDQGSPSLQIWRDGDGSAFPHAMHANVFDALWAGLGTRADHPAFNGSNAEKNRFRALGIGEAANVAAYGNALSNPLGSSSMLEKYFPVGMGRAGGAIGAATSRQPYSPDQFGQWYANIYDYREPNPVASPRTLNPNVTPLRPLLSPHAVVTNYVPAFGPNATEIVGDVTQQELQRAGKYRYRGNFPPAGLAFFHVGDWVRYGAGTASRAYVCIADHAAGSVVPVGAPASGMFWAAAPWYHHPVKINLNTASYGQLKAAFYAVMGDGPERRPATTGDPAFGNPGEIWTFGNPLRPDGAGGSRSLTPRQVKQLRAALAALSAIDLRDQDDDVSSRLLVLDDPTRGATQAIVRAYGTERQPYITSCTVDISDMDQPYVLIELFNPYPAPMPLNAFRLAYQDKVGGAFTALGAKLSGKWIPANGYLYIESGKDKRPNNPVIAGGATEDIAKAKVITDILDRADQPGNASATIEIPELEDLLKADGGARKELYLLRTRQFNGAETNNTNVENPFNENNLDELVPADQVDFTGITFGLNRLSVGEPPMLVPITDRYHYRRATADENSAAGNRWHCVYGGPYNRTLTGGEERPQRGFVRDKRPDRLTPKVLNVTLPGLEAKAHSPADVTHNEANLLGREKVATFRTRSLQVANAGAAGPNPMVTDNNGNLYNRAPVPMFPYGGFARVGDILQVTFVGGYRSTLGGYTDLQSISQDAGFADDGDLADDVDGSGGPLEQLGRFCPINNGTITDLDTKPVLPNAIGPRPEDDLQPSHRYAWAVDLFDYFTVTSPQDDYFPNVDPNGFGTPASVSMDPSVTSHRTYPKFPQQPPGAIPGGAGGIDAVPTAVPNGPAVTTSVDANHDGREDGTPVRGLINLNTAPWKVMATLPFTSDPLKNAEIAQMIVKYRELGTGPTDQSRGALRNLFDLNRVFDPGNAAIRFETGAGWAGNVAALNPVLGHGDLSPSAGLGAGLDTDDHVFGDFEARYLMINRISNMVTFRSDSFTAYVVVQGWRNAGTNQPELVAQRRVASIVDRSTVRPVLSNTAGPMQFTPPVTVNVPQN